MNKSLITNSFKIKQNSKGYLLVTFSEVLESDQEIILQTKLIKDSILRHFSKDKKKKFKILINIKSTGEKTKNLPEEAQSIYRYLSRHRQVKAVAVVGPKKIVPSIFKFILNTIFNTWYIDYFYSEDNAMEWLDRRN
jgi:uncharacterized protein with HEPN domain